jgi:HEAT repeat protein
MDALGDDDLVRARAAWALGELKAAAAVERLTRCLRQTEHPEVRRSAAVALGAIDSSPAVRDAARRAVEELHRRVLS